jgi:hypothetical protein
MVMLESVLIIGFGRQQAYNLDGDLTYIAARKPRFLAEKLVELIAFGRISFKAESSEISIAHLSFIYPTSEIVAKTL